MKKEKTETAIINGQTLNLKMNVDLIKTLIELINKRPDFRAQLICVDGTVLNLWDTSKEKKKDDSMLGW